MNTWMIRRNLMNHHYVKKKIFTVTEICKILQLQTIRMQNGFV